LLRVRSVALAAAADATPFHPANAAGTLSYQHGTFSLRDEHVGENEWVLSRPSGVEAIEMGLFARALSLRTLILLAMMSSSRRPDQKREQEPSDYAPKIGFSIFPTS
jgi:hypothetical protein